MWSFFKDQGYIWETSLSGHYTYAPKGKRVKNNLEDYLRKQFTYYGFEEVETPLIFRQEVWEKSGHWQRFQDPVIHTKSGQCYRIDKILEEEDPYLDYSSLSNIEICKLLSKLNEKWLSKDDKVDLLLIPENNQIEYHSLMMLTKSGRKDSGLRPETATATYYHYKDLLQINGGKYPINVFQIGKSFRNEINPKNNIIRGREFNQAEFQVILEQDMKNNPPPDLAKLSSEVSANVAIIDKTTGKKTVLRNKLIKSLPTGGTSPTSCLYYNSLLALIYKIFLKLGLPPENIRLRQHTKDEMAFYALDAWDIEVNLKGLGWTEVAGIHDRGNYDLRSASKSSNSDSVAGDSIAGDAVAGDSVVDDSVPNNLNSSNVEIPHILEIAVGIDRLFYSIMDNLYEEKDATQGKSTWKIPYYLAPIQVSVLPLVKNKPSIVEKSLEVYEMLRTKFATEYSDRPSIGKRYLRNAQKGIPYSVTIDFETLEGDTIDTVTVRDRDTENQVRVKINDLEVHLYKLLNL